MFSKIAQDDFVALRTSAQRLVEAERHVRQSQIPSAIDNQAFHDNEIFNDFDFLDGMLFPFDIDSFPARPHKDRNTFGFDDHIASDFGWQ